MISTMATADDTTSAPFGWMSAAPAVSGSGMRATSCGLPADAATDMAAATVTAMTTTHNIRHPGSNDTGAWRNPPPLSASTTRLGTLALPPLAAGATNTAPTTVENGTTRHCTSEGRRVRYDHQVRPAPMATPRVQARYGATPPLNSRATRKAGAKPE